ncbi:MULTISPECIES: DNA methyltransferase [Streptococcus]|uniref:DNA methyltransferase n=1 Tax=Streptococcus TaxID=1301 RepID=UPI000CF5B52D|nr:DNA methyltransferase [Streptococcus suis]MBM0194703.1 modification methylase [Streptococcus suis]MBM7317408.1 modification methylase [Streptococcus suis]HEM4765995.1 modification methylase [Streptococcus suis]HEM5029704.1 modification methylase [Streptococcus suis]HEM5105267.1 modification methylase [Streptococcus suis]
MALVDWIEKKELDYWDFSKTFSTGIHKISAYPATMVPDMQNELIRLIKLEDSNIENILDPFHGSGVTLVEGEKNGLEPIGIDINPLANLITIVKLQGVKKIYIKSANKRLKKLVQDNNFKFEVHSFNNIEKWYREDFIYTFSKIRSAIKQEKYKYIRQYYWVCLINVLKKYSNTRSSTFKLHIKTQEDIESMVNKIEEDFFNNIETFFQYLPEYSKGKKINIVIGKSEEVLSKFDDYSIDLICTSPPYGDNSSTVTYGQYSMLPIYWIDKKDLGNFDENLIENYSSIDSNSLGGNFKRSRFEIDSKILENYLSVISADKHKKVKNFISDYFDVLSELVRVLKKEKYLVLTLGNRRVDNQVVPLSDITEEYLEKKGLRLETSITRNIPQKRMPRKVSRVDNHAVESMNQEYVLIFRK